MNTAPRRKGKWSLRYYICLNDDVLMRLPHSIHRKIVDGELKIPQFANRRIRLLEAFVSTIDRGKLLDACGSVYDFGPNGELQLHDAVEGVSLTLDKANSRNATVIDIGPSIRARNWAARQTWKPSASILQKVRSDLSKDASKIPSIATLLMSSKSSG
jgi:hypothetical protein